ncbi:hypothetical protein JHK85_034709 [Glycine max]|nr:hypothetical protein JHK85_034709 [Glycine max]
MAQRQPTKARSGDRYCSPVNKDLKGPPGDILRQRERGPVHWKVFPTRAEHQRGIVHCEEGLLDKEKQRQKQKGVRVTTVLKVAVGTGARCADTCWLKVLFGKVRSAAVKSVYGVANQKRPRHAVPTAVKATPENSVLEFEAKSGRDGAWSEVLVRFAGFGPEEDEWINIRKHVRPRSLPCESSECVVVIPGDLILCFQEGKEQALYFDAHVLDAQRRRHDVRGCRCRFLVRYDHDQSEEIVPLRKICRRPETDYRLQQLHAVNEAAPMDQQKTGMDPAANVNAVRATTTETAANVNAVRATTTETVPKQLIAANIHMETVPVVQTNVPQPPQSMDMGVDQKKAETNTDVQAGNSIITPGSVLTNIITTSGVPKVSSQTQNMVE